MKTIWKYPLKIIDSQTINMPINSKILSVHKQNNELCLWAMVNPNAKYSEQRHIIIYGTGNQIHNHTDTEHNFIGTVVMTGFVWHVFEKI